MESQPQNPEFRINPENRIHPENFHPCTKSVSLYIKFTRQGFENSCRHREASQAIQHAFSKLSLVNLISKDTNLVFYLSVNPLIHSSN